MEYLVNKGFNYSGCYNLNLFLRSNNFYVMDNHGAALWAWIQHFNKAQCYNFIHIDKHYDTFTGNLDLTIHSLPKNLKEISIAELYELKYKHGKEEFQTIRWDNNISIFNKLYGQNISHYAFYTHRYGNTGTKVLDQEKTNEWSSMSLFENLGDLIIESENKTILNLDIDYFFLYHENNYTQLFSDESIDLLFSQISECYLNYNKIEVVSVALSPEACGGWSNSVMIINRLLEKLGLDKL